LSGWAQQLIILPIILPLLAGTAMVLVTDHRQFKAGLGIASMAALVVLAVLLLLRADSVPGAEAAAVQVYRLGDWPAAFGIVLVLDRLSALMLLLSALLGLAALTFSLARWQNAGPHFHPLFQFQLMGLNGAFLTGDLFNLFVFFEVMLAASYGLLLHGSGTARVRAGLHYIAINLTASLLFLVGVSMVYGLTGTLNMADLAGRIPAMDPADRGLFEAGMAILGIAFLIKAGMWPLGFWLVPAYAAASTPAAAILSILSKVGIYAVLRLWLLLFGEGAGPSAGFGATWLMAGGLLTILYGCIAVLATQSMPRLAGASVLVSSGTLLAAVGAGQVTVTGGALFYMASSILGIAAFFLLIELVERNREEVGADVLAVTREAFGTGEEDEPEDDAVGVAIPATIAILGLSFSVCALLLAGLPPLSGFLAKFAMLAPLFAGGEAAIPAGSWLLLAALLLSGLATVVAMTRTGIDAFWASTTPAPRVGLVEIAPVVGLLVLAVAMTVQAGPVLRYMQAAADGLHRPAAYIGSVVDSTP
jgi:multicomponent K+:H+ antiporter subunit D